VLGSDWPVAPFDPRRVLADAQLRRPAGEPDVLPVQPHQGLSPLAALQGYTATAAWAAGEAGGAGRIAVGARADLTAFTVDPLRAAADELADAPIALTVVDGSVVHRASSAE
jgi:predicted amidohydrolase YtcJ